MFLLFFVEAEDLCYLHKNINDQSGNKEKRCFGRVGYDWEEWMLEMEIRGTGK